MDAEARAEALTARARRCFEQNRVVQADLLTRQALAIAPDHAGAATLLAAIVAWVDARAARCAAAPARQRFLLIRAWGCGFWSDVDHVLGQLLLAEITGRTPVVHWGANSLFGSGEGRSDAFARFFRPVSTVTAPELVGRGYSFFPPKWNDANLFSASVNPWHGAWSRLGAIECLERAEEVVVSDFHAAVAAIAPWIPPASPLACSSVAELYRRLMQRYLVPRDDIVAEIDEFQRARLQAPFVLAVHVRGSDKLLEDPRLHEVNRRYPATIARALAARPSAKIFVLTDSTGELVRLHALYGDRLVHTDCTRSDDQVGVHRRDVGDRARLGVEVMKDAYLASRADAFVGNGWSNVSCMITHLGQWPPGRCALFGPNLHETINLGLHDHDRGERQP